MKMMQEGTRAVAILMIDEAACSTRTAVMQYVKKFLSLIFNKVNNITTVMEEISTMAKIITENAKQTVDKTSTQRHKDKETGGGVIGVTYICSSPQR